MKKKQFIVFANLFIALVGIAISANATTYYISGKVTGKSGTGIPGISVGDAFSGTIEYNPSGFQYQGRSWLVPANTLKITIGSFQYENSSGDITLNQGLTTLTCPTIYDYMVGNALTLGTLDNSNLNVQMVLIDRDQILVSNPKVLPDYLPTTGWEYHGIRIYYTGNANKDMLCLDIDNFNSNLTPTITTITPSTIVAGGGPFVLTVNGSNFISSSTLQWNGASKPTTYVNSSQLTALIAASDIATSGTVVVQVIVPSPISTASNTVTFSITPKPITFAQLALGNGYEANLFVTNKSNSKQSAIIRPCQTTGSVWAGKWSVNGVDRTGLDRITVDIPAKGTVKMIFRGDSTTRDGYLQIIPPDSSGTLSFAYYYAYYSEGLLKSTTGSPPSKTCTRCIFAVENTVTSSTGFAWAPTPELPLLPLNLTLIDGTGGTVQKKQIVFAGHLARFVHEIFGVPYNFVGSVFIESDKPIFLEVLRLEQISGGFLLTSTPPDELTP